MSVFFNFQEQLLLSIGIISTFLLVAREKGIATFVQKVINYRILHIAMRGVFFLLLLVALVGCAQLKEVNGQKTQSPTEAFIEDTLELGQSKSYTLNKKDYTVTFVEIDGDNIKLNVNGAVYTGLLMSLPDGTTVKITDRFYLKSNPPISVVKFQLSQETRKCAGEGESIPVIPNPPQCCSGLTLIPLKEVLLGSKGICTALCSNGICNNQTENLYNCPQDCSGKS